MRRRGKLEVRRKKYETFANPFFPPEVSGRAIQIKPERDEMTLSHL
jgi:hypothetical protein